MREEPERRRQLLEKKIREVVTWIASFFLAGSVLSVMIEDMESRNPRWLENGLGRWVLTFAFLGFALGYILSLVQVFRKLFSLIKTSRNLAH